MDCSICFEAYDDGSRVPKQLSCGHSLCARCATACADSESRLRCPQCQKVTLAPENTFTTNYELLNFLMICKANQQKKRVTFVRQEANDSTDLLRNSLKLVKGIDQQH
uniref:RING-type domain-containing protein n=1 Tax=Plectus sambesii TaxID=2011161 RepID=A0A914WAU8_9BILA